MSKLILLLCVFTLASAKPLHYGVRSLGLGGAMTSVSNDQNALYENPAGLASLPTWDVDFLTLGVMASTNDQALATTIQKQVAALGGSFSSLSPANINFSEFIYEVSAKPYSLGVFWNPYFVKKNFGMAFDAVGDIELTLHGLNDEFIDASARFVTDSRFAVAQSYFNNRLDVGWAFAFKTQHSVIQSFSTDSVVQYANQPDTLKNLLAAGWALDLNTGVILRPWENWSPSIGIDVNHIFNTYYFPLVQKIGGSPNPTPPTEPQSFNIGFSLEPKSGHWFLLGALDFKDINLPTLPSQKFSLGLESGWKTLYQKYAFQVGFSEGSYTAGTELRFPLFSFRFATYALQKGYYTDQLVDRKYVLQIKIII